MIGSKPLASLSSTLLARKGAARPAMRSQGFGGFAVPSDIKAQDDLGWNDMGAPDTPDAPAETAGGSVPPVLVQRKALHAGIAAASVPKCAAKQVSPGTAPRSVSLATAIRIRRDTSAKHVANARSAFTLRLDTDRHLKLRLASALQNRSAQQLVTAALDAFLETLPEVDTLVSQLPVRAKA